MRAGAEKTESCGNCLHYRTDGTSGTKYCGNTGSPANGTATTAYGRCDRHEGKGERKWKAAR